MIRFRHQSEWFRSAGGDRRFPISISACRRPVGWYDWGVESRNPGRLRRVLKWIWLLSHALTFPLAILYFVRTHLPVYEPASRALSAFLSGAGLICLAASPVIWIITESMLSMYRFPLSARRAAMLVGGFYCQLGIVSYAGESVAFAMFVCVYTNLLAAFACAAPLFARILRREQPAHPAALRMRGRLLPAAAATTLLLLAPPAVLFPYLRAGFAQMEGTALLSAILATLANTALAARELIGLSVFGRPDPRDQEYSAEWERWAAPTVILLILSVVAGIIIAGATR